jgi:hypothetical protein
MAEIIRLLAIDRSSAAYQEYEQAFREYCKHEEGTAPREVFERVKTTYRSWVTACTSALKN